MEIKKELRVTLKSKAQFNEITSIMREHVGPGQESWRLRKVMPNGEKNTGKRCRIIKHLDRGTGLDIIVEIYTNEDKISEADLMFATLKH